MLKLLMIKRDMLFVPDSEDIDVVVGRMGRLREDTPSRCQVVFCMQQNY